MYLVARQRPLQRRSRTRTNSKPRRRRRHGQGTATQQPRDQEAEEGQDQDQRRSAQPQGCGVAAGDRSEEEVAGRTEARLDLSPNSVMAGLVPAIHALRAEARPWMPGTSPGMTSLWRDHA